MAELASRSPDASPHRADEPYRRALTGIYARLAATARVLGQHEALRHAVGEAGLRDRRRAARRSRHYFRIVVGARRCADQLPAAVCNA